MEAQTVRTFAIGAEHSRFTVQAFASGLLAGFAHSPKFAIRSFEGQFRFAPPGSGDSSFQLSVKSSSLELRDDVKPSDREEIQRTTFDEVLEVGVYPVISFDGAQIAFTLITDSWYRARIRGNMNLHGLKPLEIDSQLRLAEGEIRLSGTFGLLISQFKIKPVKNVGGLIKLKDELKFDFDLMGREEVPRHE